jgi:phasin family protein
MRRQIATIAAFCTAAKQVSPFLTFPFKQPGSYAMIALPEDFTTYQKSAMDNLVKFADAWSNAAEQLFDLNVKSAKAGGQEALKQIHALATAKDVQELFAMQSSFAQENAEKSAGFARALYTWGSDTQGEISKLVDSQMGELNRTFAAAIDRAAKSAPNGSEFAFAAVKQAVSSANQAYDAIAKAGKQVAEMTESTVSATANAVAPAAKKKAA